MQIQDPNRLKAFKALNQASLDTVDRPEIGTRGQIHQALRTYEVKPSAFKQYVLENYSLAPITWHLSTDDYMPNPIMDNVWKTAVDSDYDYFKEQREAAEKAARDAMPWWQRALGDVMESPSGRLLKTLGIPLGVTATVVSDAVDLFQVAIAKKLGRDPNWDENNPFAWERIKSKARILTGEEYFSFGEWLHKENWLQNSWSTNVPLNPLYYVGVGPRFGMTFSASGLTALPADLILDPLNWFGGLGAYRQIGLAAIRNANKIIRASTKEMLETAFERNVVRQVGQQGDEIVSAQIRALVPDEAIDDLSNQVQKELAELGHKATSAEYRQVINKVLDDFAMTQSARGGWLPPQATPVGGMFPVGVTPQMGASSSRLFFKGADDLIEEYTQIASLTLKAKRFGRSALTIDDIRLLGNYAQRKGLNVDMLTPQQWIEAGGAKLDDAGNVIEGQWNRLLDDFVPFADDLEKISYGFKIPFTGEIARNTTVPFSRHVGKKQGITFAEGAQKIFPAETINKLAYRVRLTPTLGIADRQYGITIFKFSSPTLDKTFRALPQLFRGTWGRYATRQGVRQLTKLEGGLPTAKQIMKGSNNPWEVVAAKELFSWNGQARMLSMRARKEFDKPTNLFLNKVRAIINNDLGNIKPILNAWKAENNVLLGDFPTAYAKNDSEAFQRLLMSAIEGDDSAIAVMEQVALKTGVDLVGQGATLMESLRLMANSMAGTDFLSRRLKYFPHQLTDEWKAAIASKKRGSTVGPEQRRFYVEPKEFETEFEKWFADNYTPVRDPQGKVIPPTDAQMASFRRQFANSASSPRTSFFGQELGNIGYPNPMTGRVYGTIPEQMSEILENLGMNGEFFSFNMQKVLDNYNQGLSNLVGMNWLNQRIIKGGWSPNATGWVTGLKMPSAASVAASRRLTRMVQTIKQKEVEIDEAIIRSAEAEVAQQRLINETITNLENQHAKLLADYETELSRALDREQLLIKRETMYGEAVEKTDELFNKLMQVMDEQERFMFDIERFKAGEISIEEFPQFQRAIEANVELQELQEILQRLMIGGEDITDNVYYYLYESLSNGVQTRAKIEQHLIEKFGSVERARDAADKYTQAIAEVIQANRNYEAHRVTNMSVFGDDVDLELSTLNTIWNDSVGREIWQTTTDDIIRVIKGIDAEVDPSQITDPALRAIRQDLKRELEMFIRSIDWEEFADEAGNIPNIASMYEDYLQAKVRVSTEVNKLLEITQGLDAAKAYEFMPELLQIPNWHHMTSEELLPVIMRQVEQDLPAEMSAITNFNKLGFQEVQGMAGAEGIGQMVDRKVIELTLRRWEDDIARMTFPDAPPQRAQALDEPAFRDPLTGRDVTPLEREQALEQVSRVTDDVAPQQKITAEELTDIQTLEIENTIKYQRQRWESANAKRHQGPREGEEIQDYLKRNFEERGQVNPEDELVTPMGAARPDEDVLARMGPEPSPAKIRSFMTPHQAVKVLNDGGVSYRVMPDGTISQMIGPKTVVLSDGSEMSFREISQYFDTEMLRFDEGMGQWFQVSHYDAIVKENPANLPASMFKTLETMDMEISSLMDELDQIAKKFSSLEDQGPIAQFGVPTVENVEQWRNLIKAHLHDGVDGQLKVFANPEDYRELGNAIRQYFLLMGKQDLGIIQSSDDLVVKIAKYREVVDRRLVAVEEELSRNPFAKLEEYMKVELDGIPVTMEEIARTERYAKKFGNTLEQGVQSPVPLKKFDIDLDTLNPEMRIEPEVIGFHGSDAFPVAAKDSHLLDGFYKGADGETYYVRSFSQHDNTTPQGKKKNFRERDEQLAAQKVYEILGVAVPRMEARVQRGIAYSVMRINENIKPYVVGGEAGPQRASRSRAPIDPKAQQQAGAGQPAYGETVDMFSPEYVQPPQDLTQMAFGFWGIPVEPQVLKMSDDFIADVLLGNWSVNGTGAARNYGILWGDINPVTGRPSGLDAWANQAERFGRFTTVRYGMDDAFFTARGIEKHLPDGQTYKALEYVDGRLQLVEKQPTTVSIDDQNNIIVSKSTPESLADDGVKAQQVYEAEMVQYNKELTAYNQDRKAWEKYDIELKSWEANSGKSTVATNAAWDMTDDQIRQQAAEELAERLTKEQGLYHYADDVPDTHPFEFDAMVDEINASAMDNVSFVPVDSPPPLEPPRPRPTVEPTRPKAPKGVKEITPRDRVSYTQLDGTVVERKARKPSKIEIKERKNPLTQEWLETKGFAKGDRIYGTQYTQWRTAGFAARRAQRKIKKLEELKPKDLEAQIMRVKDDLAEELNKVFEGVDDLARQGDPLTPNRASGQPREVVGVNYDITEVMELGLGPKMYGAIDESIYFPNDIPEDIARRLPSGFMPDSMNQQVERMLHVRNSVGGWRNYLENAVPNLDTKTLDELAHFLEVRTKYLSEYFGLPYLTDEDEMLKQFASNVLPTKVVLDTWAVEGKAGLLRLLDNTAGYDDTIAKPLGLSDVMGHQQSPFGGKSRMTLAPYAYREGVKYQGLAVDTEMGQVKFYGVDPIFQVKETQEVTEALLKLDAHSSSMQDGTGLVGNFNEFQDALYKFWTELSPANPAGLKGDDLSEFTEQILRLVGWEGPTKLMPQDMISLGERLVDILGRQDPLVMDEIIRVVSKDALTTSQVKELELLLANKYKGSLELQNADMGLPQADSEVIQITPAGISPATGEGKIILNDIYRVSEGSGVPTVVDTMTAATRRDTITSVRTLARVRSIRAAIKTDPIMSNYFKEGGTFQEVLEFLSWRDNKYRQIDSVNSYLTRDGDRFNNFMDDLGEYAYATSPSNPNFKDEILKAKMQSYVHVNRVMQLFAKVEGADSLLGKRMIDDWKLSLANDGYIGVAQPRTFGEATYEHGVNSTIRKARLKFKRGDYKDTSFYSRGAQDSQRTGLQRYGDLDDVIDDPYYLQQESTLQSIREASDDIDATGIDRRMNPRKASILEDETWDAMADQTAGARKGTVQAPFTMDFTITNPNAIVVDPAWAASRAQQQINAAIDVHHFLAASNERLRSGVASRVYTAKGLADTFQGGDETVRELIAEGTLREVDAETYVNRFKVLERDEKVPRREGVEEGATGIPKPQSSHHVVAGFDEIYTDQKIYAFNDNPVLDEKWQKWWNADEQELIDEIVASKIPTRESLIKRYDEQVRNFLNNPTLDFKGASMADKAAYEALQASARGNMFPLFLKGGRPKGKLVERKGLQQALDIKDQAAYDIGRENYSLLKKDVFENINESKQIKYNMENLQAHYVDRLKALGDLHKIRTSRPYDTQLSKDVERLRRWMPDEDIEVTGLAKELEDVELRILQEKQALDFVTQRIQLHVDARNKLKNMIDGFADDDLLALGSLENLLDFAASLKQIGINDLDEIDYILKTLNNPKPDIDQLFVPKYSEMSEKTKERLFTSLIYAHDAAKNPVGLANSTREGITETIMGTTKLGLDTSGKPPRTLVQYYDNVHNVTKGYMILKAGFLARNFYGALWMNYLADVPVSAYSQFLNAYRYLKYQDEIADAAIFGASKPKLRRRVLRDAQQLADAARKKTTPRDINAVRAMMDGGLIGKEGSGFYGQEFIPDSKRTITIGGREIQTVKRWRGRDWNIRSAIPFSSQFFVLRKFRGANATVEDVVRGSLGLHTLNSGGTVDDAWDNIVKWHFDYSDLSPTERKIKRLIPFYTWSRHALPLTIGQFFQQPAKFHRYAITMRALSDKEDRDIGPVPDWMLRQGGVRLPESMDVQGNPVYFMPDLPIRSTFDMINDPLREVAQGDILGAAGATLRSGASMMTPLVKAPLELMMNRNIWKDYSFKDRYEHVPFWLEKVPLLMPMLESQGVAKPLPNGGYAIKSKWLHFLTQVTPPISDLRRIAPTEEKYQERHFSNIMSWFFGIGLRTLSPYEIEQAAVGKYYEDRQKVTDANRLQMLDAIHNNN